MAAELDFGAVPPLYLEVLNVLESQGNGPSLSQEVFYSIFETIGGLTKSVLYQVWNLCSSDSRGMLKRTGIIKCLALIAFAQQGRTLSEKLILNFSGEALPVPQLDLQSLRSLHLHAKMKKNGCGYTLRDIFALDSVEVQVIPEKKGLFLKHVEYEVTSKKYKTTVKRRYSDFITFHDIILQRHPFRLVPMLPPKRMMGGDAEFVEERRKSLKRFLNLVARHPVLMEDRSVQFFLTFIGSDVQHKIKDYTKNIQDVEIGPNSDTPYEGSQAELAAARERLRQVHITLTNLRTLSHHMVDNNEECRDSILNLGKEFSSLSKFISTDLYSDPNRKVLEQLYPHFAAISTINSQQAQLEQEEVVERQDMLLDLLAAYKDLGDRYDTAFSQENANRRMALKRSTSSPTGIHRASEDARDASLSPSFQSRKMQAMQSLLAETQLVQTYLELLWVLLQSLVTIRSTWLKKTADLWDKMLPLVDGLQLPMCKESLKSPDSPTR